MKSKLIKGFHHVTALASDPRRNVAFYTEILGLRLVKKTINFDAPDVYHLYYGNESGSPGTLLTFFPFPDIAKGRKGKGQLTVTAFSISENALDFWMKRLRQFHISFAPPSKRFNDSVIYFEDHDGLGIELVANSHDQRKGFERADIALELAIKGLYGITLSEECLEKTARLLIEQLDYTLVAEEGNRFRYSVGHEPGHFVDIVCQPDALRGVAGHGTVHHVAFATENEATQLEARDRLMKLSLDVTPIVDRTYFHSIYFREPGGVLFEIATMAPGFTLDEPLAHLGESLQLPPWLERSRKEIEKSLPLIIE